MFTIAKETNNGIVFGVIRPKDNFQNIYIVAQEDAGMIWKNKIDIIETLNRATNSRQDKWEILELKTGYMQFDW